MNRRLFITLLEESVVNGSPKLILKSLFLKNILTDMPNKVRFYSFYKKSINCLHSNAKGGIYVRISIKFNSPFMKEEYLDFYDTYFINPRLTMIVQEKNKELTVNILPF